MPDPTSVRDALASESPRESILVRGWVRTRRDAKKFSFVEINDGSCLAGLQAMPGVGPPAVE